MIIHISNKTKKIFFYLNQLKKYPLLVIFLIISQKISGESVAEKATFHRNYIIATLRLVQTMAYNFPCDPYPECLPPDPEKKIKDPGLHVTLYRKAKRTYQEGIVYFYEKNYVNAYSKFLETQGVIDKLLEYLSQQYIDRAELMLREAIEKKNPNEPTDMSVVDISIDYGPNSKQRKYFAKPMEKPVDVRNYDPRNFHWATNKYFIEQSTQVGYENLEKSKRARKLAVSLQTEVSKTKDITPDMIVKRIDYYKQSIELSRQAKKNAEFIFALKYPYDNYPLHNPFGKTEKIDEKQGEVPSLHGVKMNWSENPYVLPKNLHPIFDFRVPEKWHVDTVDLRGMRFDEEFDRMIKFRYIKGKKPTEILEDKSDPKPTKPIPDL